jgi:hypothetical protein
VNFGSWTSILRVTALVLIYKMMYYRRTALMLLLCLSEPIAFDGKDKTYTTLAGSADTYNQVIATVVCRLRGIDA